MIPPKTLQLLALIGFSCLAAAPLEAALDCRPLDTIPVSATTGEKPQSKVWSYAGRWWTALPTTARTPVGTWLWRLEPDDRWTAVAHVSAITDAQVDVEIAGEVVHLLLAGSESELVSLEYETASQAYVPWSLRPASTPVTIGETGTIAIDTTGRMWLATESGSRIEIDYADPPYASFSGPVILDNGVDVDDIGVVTALPNGSIGVLWSNQVRRRFGFAVHVDSDNPGNWSADEMPASQSALEIGLGMADDHVNVAVGPDGTLFAAVKTSYDTAGFPRIALLVRRPDTFGFGGSWEELHGVDELGTRPIVLHNAATDELHVVYTNRTLPSDIVYRESSGTGVGFGPEQVLRAGELNNVTSIKGSWTHEVVLLASDATSADGIRCQPDNPPLCLADGECDDGNPCTVDECDPLTGCFSIPLDGLLLGNTQCGVGPCRATGELRCEAGEAVDSCQAGMPEPEVCGDGIDNDCDAVLDCADDDCASECAGTDAEIRFFFNGENCTQETCDETTGYWMNPPHEYSHGDLTPTFSSEGVVDTVAGLYGTHGFHAPTSGDVMRFDVAAGDIVPSQAGSICMIVRNTGEPAVSGHRLMLTKSTSSRSFLAVEFLGSTNLRVHYRDVNQDNTVFGTSWGGAGTTDAMLVQFSWQAGAPQDALSLTVDGVVRASHPTAEPLGELIELKIGESRAREGSFAYDPILISARGDLDCWALFAGSCSAGGDSCIDDADCVGQGSCVGVKTELAELQGPADQCPDDPDKLFPGACGCGVADADRTGDGLPDCAPPSRGGTELEPGVGPIRREKTATELRDH